MAIIANVVTEKQQYVLFIVELIMPLPTKWTAPGSSCKMPDTFVRF